MSLVGKKSRVAQLSNCLSLDFVKLGSVRLVGILFIASSLSKAISPYLYFGILRSVSLSIWMTIGGLLVLLFEAWVGMALTLAPTKRWIAAAIMLLAFFTVFIPLAMAHGWISKDCGCFGGLLSMSPASAVVRNLTICALLVWGWKASHHDSTHVLSGAYAGILLAGWALRKAWQLHTVLKQLPAKGDVIVISPTCGSCRQLCAQLAGTKMRIDTIITHQSGDAQFDDLIHKIGQNVIHVSTRNLTSFSNSFPAFWSTRAGHAYIVKHDRHKIFTQ